MITLLTNNHLQTALVRPPANDVGTTPGAAALDLGRQKATERVQQQATAGLAGGQVVLVVQVDDKRRRSPASRLHHLLLRLLRLCRTSTGSRRSWGLVG